MDEDLKRLKAALETATPEPERSARDRALALAQKNFAASQEPVGEPRPTYNRPSKTAGYLLGVRNMIASLGRRPALYAGSSLAVLGLALFVVLPMNFTFKPALEQLPEVPEIGVTAQLEAPAIASLAAPRPGAEAVPTYELSLSDQVSSAIVALKRRVEVGDLTLPQPDRERFANGASNPVKITTQDPVSTFSIDVDTASYAYVRSTLMGGNLPDAEAVRIEEMVNYFPYDYVSPSGADAPFRTNVSLMTTPWNPDTQLLHVSIQGEMPEVADRPALNLVFLIDTSGSMQGADRLPLLKQSFRLLLSRLRPQDQVAIVTYAGSSGLVLEPTSASERSVILAALDRLEAGGSTAGQAGLQLAYATADNMAGEGRLGRILLATDGDFNVGISDPEALKSYVEEKRNSGTYLSVLGFGRGNYNDALMQSLAQNGNGTASYIDTFAEAQKVLVDQVSGALFPIANDVKIQVEFNPSVVAEYRLIGYETRLLAREDFNNDKVDAGDIGAGHQVTALYEITPVGSPALKSDPLRYQAPTIVGDASAEIGFLKLRYKLPGESESALITTPIGAGGDRVSSEVRFAAAIAGFGQLLRGGKYLGDWGYAQAITLAGDAVGADQYGYRREALTLMRLAESLSR